MSRNNEEFNTTVIKMTEDLLKMGVDTYNKVKFTLLSYQSKHDACREYLLKLFAFTDQHRPLLIEMKGGAAQ